MIGQTITGPDGKPLPQLKLELSAYQPPHEVKELFSRCQKDYQMAWTLQHKPLDEFDGYSLLQRTKLDQQTFGAFVGAEWVAKHKKWRWRGRKNTARDKLIGMLAHMLAGMLYPVVHAFNEQNESDKASARVMRLIVEDHLRKAGYEIKFLYMVLSALVNPAVIVHVAYLEAWQTIKQRLASGEIKITQAVDTFLSGLALKVKPIDQFMIADVFTPDIQTQPFTIDVERISYDTAKKIYGGRFFANGIDLFDYVEAGKTRVFLTGQENGTLYDIDWSEADNNYVQVLTIRYRDEDLELAWVGGVGLFNYDNPYNSNPFSHRRLSLIGDEWVSVPIYPFAKSFFEPIDPTGRFFYGKSGAFKLYWDDATQNKMHQLWVDGTTLDVFKPMFATGLANVDSTVIAPAAVIGMPPGGSVNQYSLGPNLNAALQVMQKQEQDMSESTQDKIMGGQTQAGVTATASLQAQNQARLMLGLFGLMVADLIKQVGELTTDCVIQHVTVAEIDTTIPTELRMKQKTLLIKGKEKGKDVTNRVVFTDKFMGRKMTNEQKDEYEWKLWDEANGITRDEEGKITSRRKDMKDQYIHEVNPYKLARMKYGWYVDPDKITNAAYGNDRMQKIANFNILTDPRIAPYTDQKAVAEEVIEEFSTGDPDRFKAKGDVNALMGGIMGQGGVNPGSPSPMGSNMKEQMAGQMI